MGDHRGALSPYETYLAFEDVIEGADRQERAVHAPGLLRRHAPGLAGSLDRGQASQTDTRIHRSDCRGRRASWRLLRTETVTAVRTFCSLTCLITKSWQGID